MDEKEFKLGFQISKVSNINDAYLQINYMEYNEFKNFSGKVDEKPERNLGNIIVISESRPIANIVVKEPYMYRAQVMDKISKGKGYEVLRNKIIRSDTSTKRIEQHLKNVFDREYKFSEIDKDNKTYIDLNVNGINILSQGSGFLQIAEIFSSLEYVNAGIYVLLIDEPDSHIHAKLQKRLIDELRSIQNSQLFVISHNERFLTQINEDEIRFISHDTKNGHIVDSLPEGCKGIVFENLIGLLNKSEQLRFARNIVLLEGKTDLNFIERMIPKYEQFKGIKLHNYFIDMLNGIDTLHEKMLVYSRAVKELVPATAKWTIVRDNDCLPMSKQNTAKEENIKNIDVHCLSVKFQNGYGIESTFVSEPDNFTKILLKYYQIDESASGKINNIITDLNKSYENKVKNVTDSINKEFEKNFQRQKTNRREKIYNKLQFRDVLTEINPSNIQYIMTKGILDSYLGDIHNEIDAIYEIEVEKLNSKTIFDAYYVSISSLSDFFECHLELLNSLE
ncbi:MAG: AAA family ATPase [Ignavibacteria bacterium]|nr:AAA family ATPase [Ignavibacteria bacterium]